MSSVMYEENLSVFCNTYIKKKSQEKEDLKNSQFEVEGIALLDIYVCSAFIYNMRNGAPTGRR